MTSINPSNVTVELLSGDRVNVRDDIARIYFYMEDRYELKISRKQRQLFEAWSRMDPADAAELARGQRIAEVQGTGMDSSKLAMGERGR